MKRFLILLYSICFCSFVRAQVQLPQGLSASQWQEDFDYLEQKIQTRHIDLYRHTPKKLFDQKFAEIRQYLQKSSPIVLDHTRLTAYVFEIIALVRDNHTSVIGRYKMLKLLPITAYWFGDELRIIRTSNNYRRLLGGKLLAIGQTPIKEVYEKIKKITPHSNELGYKSKMTYYFRHPEMLQTLGIVQDQTNIVCKVAMSTGKVIQQSIKPVSLATYRQLQFSNAYNTQSKKTLSGQQPKENYWFRYLPQRKVMYVAYRRAANQKSEKAKKFWKRLLKTIDTLQVDKLVIDLRNNSGGMPNLHAPLVIGIQKRSRLNQKGKLFTLINRGTESAAIVMAMQLENRTNTLFVGEGIGDRPHHLSDARHWRLPHSKIVVGLPILYYQNTYEYDQRWNITPHIAIHRSFDDYYHRRDLALEAVFNYKPELQQTAIQKIPQQIIGRYRFSEDKTLHIIQKEQLLWARISNGWQTPLLPAEENSFTTKIKGVKFCYKQDKLNMHLPSGQVKTFVKLLENEFTALELLHRKAYKQARKAYLKLHQQKPNLKALQRNNLSTLAMYNYLETGDFKKSKKLMKINAKLHPGKGFVHIRFAELYQAKGNGFMAFLCFAQGVLEGYKD